MRYRIEEDAHAAVEIHLIAEPEHQPQLLASFAQCQSGNCGCPTDQYERLEKMHVQADGENVHLHLEPRPGQRFDTKELRACLDYTASRVDPD